MKPGDLVLVEQEGREVEGVFEGFFSGDNYLIRIGDNHYHLSKLSVKKYEPIAQEKLASDCKEMLPALKEMIERACKELLNEKDYAPIETDGEIIQILNGCLALEPCAVRFPTILGIRERAGFEIVLYQSHYSYNEPEDFSESSYGVESSVIRITEKVVQALFKIRSDIFFNSVQEEKMAEEFYPLD